MLCAGAGSCLRLDHTMEGIFFKLGTEELVRVFTTTGGKIDFGLVRSMGLGPGPITLCGSLFPQTGGLLSDAKWTEIRTLLGVAGTPEDPVVVSSRPTSMFDLNLTKKQ